MSADSRIQAITARIVERSKPYRETYLERLRLQFSKGVHRSVLSCGNLAHGICGLFPPPTRTSLPATGSPISASSPPITTCFGAPAL